MEQHGVDSTTPPRRSCREHVLAMQALWTEDVASFDGEIVHLAPSWSWPKPVQAGGPPMLIGGRGRAEAVRAHRRVRATVGSPSAVRGCGRPSRTSPLACERVGRDVADLRIVPFGTVPDPGKVDYYESIGVTEIVLRVPTGDADTVLPVLDCFADLVESGR